jgi:fructosamine-3-kinase
MDNIIHSHQQSFGFFCDNTIGSTPQMNTWTNDWIEFFSKYRLQFQLDLIESKFKDREIAQLGEKLLKQIPTFFDGLSTAIKPSLIHGDLWSGNVGYDR